MWGIQGEGRWQFLCLSHTSCLVPTLSCKRMSDGKPGLPFLSWVTKRWWCCWCWCWCCCWCWRQLLWRSQWRCWWVSDPIHPLHTLSYHWQASLQGLDPRYWYAASLDGTDCLHSCHHSFLSCFPLFWEVGLKILQWSLSLHLLTWPCWSRHSATVLQSTDLEANWFDPSDFMVFSLHYKFEINENSKYILNHIFSQTSLILMIFSTWENTWTWTWKFENLTILNTICCCDSGTTPNLKWTVFLFLARVVYALHVVEDISKWKICKIPRFVVLSFLMGRNGALTQLPQSETWSGSTHFVLFIFLC